MTTTSYKVKAARRRHDGWNPGVGRILDAVFNSHRSVAFTALESRHLGPQICALESLSLVVVSSTSMLPSAHC
jgi:hypothetical protein